PGQRGGAFGGTEVGGDAAHLRVRRGLLYRGDGFVGTRLRAAGDAPRGASRGKSGGDGEADAGGGAGDDGAALAEIDVHGDSGMAGRALLASPSSGLAAGRSIAVAAKDFVVQT